MRPLHDTRALPDVLLDLAHRLGGQTSQVLPGKNYEEMLQMAVAPLARHPGSINAKTATNSGTKFKSRADGGAWRRVLRRKQRLSRVPSTR